ncbi:secretin N-terminal domain-containing protein [Pandoraea terrae]|uniref:secretin N-terminal domain-containing protein n=1 Tax=Pandoraea terrae TaxID=1537710 RepID=UPI0017800B18|nr:secretin N-terminal domain-containing protein [Pandoraea terrae]
MLAARSEAQALTKSYGAKGLSVLEREDGAWLTRRSMPIDSTRSLPAFFDTPATFTSGKALPLPLITQQIGAAHGVPIRVSRNVGAAPAGKDGRDAQRGGGRDARRAAPADGEGNGPMVTVQYKGTLRGLLDTLASRSGTHWTYRNETVEFSRFVTRTFQVKTMPGATSYAASVGKSSDTQAKRSSGGGGGGAGGIELNFGADAKVSMVAELSYWDDLVRAVSGMVSEEGRVSPSTVTSSITVTDTAEVVERIARYVEAENAVLGRQVSLRVQVYSVSLSENSAAGIDWNLVYKAANGVAVELVGAPMGAALGTGVGKLGATHASGRFNGSKLFLQALSQQGRVSTVVDTSVVTLNNQPAPIAVTDNEGYISKVSITQGNLNSMPIVTAEQSMLTTGFVMNLLPTLLDNRSVMLQVQVDLSENHGFKSHAAGLLRAGGELEERSERGKDRTSGKEGDKGGGTTSVQSPRTSSVQTMQRASLKAGETLVLSGFRQAKGNTSKDGLFMYEGGSKSASQGEREIVILISPVLTEGV